MCILVNFTLVLDLITARAVEIFLQALLTRADCYASSRNAKTLTVSHLYVNLIIVSCMCVKTSWLGSIKFCRKHCIEQEKQWDFLKELTAKIPNISTEKEEVDEAPPPKRGRYSSCHVTQGYFLLFISHLERGMTVPVEVNFQ